MRVINQTKDKLTIKYKGVEYSVDGEDAVDVPDEVATYWKNNIHQFIAVETVKVVEEKETQSTEEKQEKETKEKSKKEVKKSTNKK